MLSPKVCLFVLCVFTFSVVRVITEICATPKSLEGRCEDVQNCAEIVQILSERDLDPVKAQFVKQSQCGFDANAPKVCCAVSNETKPFQIPSKPKPRHISIGLSSRALYEEVLPEPDECGEQIYEENDRIYDGVITDLGEFPWAALLKYKGNAGDGYACGGALISKRYVLTAAHCVVGRLVDVLGPLIAVNLGDHDVSKPVDCDLTWGDDICAPPNIEVPVETYIVHPQYVVNDRNRYHDIALVRLKEPVVLSDYIQPICLPAKGMPHKPPTSLYVTGWGETRNDTASNIKLKAKLPEAQFENCSKIYNLRGVTLKTSQMCAGGEREDSCRGDSGGPLMYKDTSDPDVSRWYMVGVVSFGIKLCGSLGVPAIYTKTSEYHDWIKENVKP